MSSLLTHLTPLHRFKYYEICLSFFVVVLLISNLVAGKLCSLGHVAFLGLEFDIVVSGAQQLLATEVLGSAPEE